MTGKVFKLASEGGEVVARDFTKIGAAGEKMGQTVTKGAQGIPPALRAVDTAVNQTRGAIEGLAGRTGGLGQVLGSLGTGGLAAAAVLGGLTAIGGAAASASKDMLLLEGAAKQADVSVEFLQAARFAMTQMGRDANMLEPALKTLSVRFGEIRDGVGEGQVSLLAKLGISREDVAQFRSTEEGLLKIAEAASKVDERTRNNVLDKLGIRDLLPILDGGAAGFERIAAQARAAGVVISGDVVRGAAETARELEAAQKAMDIQFKQALLDAAPALTELAKLAAWLAREVSGVVDEFRRLEKRSDSSLNERVDDLQRKRQRLVQVYGPDVVRGGNADAGAWQADGAAVASGSINLGRDRYAYLRREIDSANAILINRQLQRAQADSAASVGGRPSAGGLSSGAGGGSATRATEAPETVALRSYIERLREAEAARVRFAAAQARMGRASDEEVRAALELEDTLKQIDRARAAGIITTDADAEALKRVAKARLEEAEAAKKAAEKKAAAANDNARAEAERQAELEKVRTLPRDIANTLEDAFVNQEWDWDAIKESWGRSFRKTLWDVFLGDTMREFETAFATKLRDIIFNKGGIAGNGGGSSGGGWVSTAVNVIASIFGKRAGGGDVYPGGSYWVGEEGPELVSFGASGYVHTAAQSRAMTGGATYVYSPTIHAPGATVDALEGVRAELRASQAAFEQWAAGEPGRARMAVREGQQRRLRR